MQKLNGSEVIFSGSFIFRSGDTYEIGDNPRLKYVISESQDAGISVRPEGYGFLVSINGFKPGMVMASTGNGTLGSRNIVISTIANRIAEYDDGPVFTVDYLLSYKD